VKSESEYWTMKRLQFQEVPKALIYMDYGLISGIIRIEKWIYKGRVFWNKQIQSILGDLDTDSYNILLTHNPLYADTYSNWERIWPCRGIFMEVW